MVTSGNLGFGSGLDLLAVRTEKGWNLTRADQRHPTPISDSAMHALVRASGAVRLADADPSRRELEAAGVALPAGGAEFPAAPAGTDGNRSSSTGPALAKGTAPSRGSVVSQGSTFVVRVAAGCLRIEGLDGQRITLDEVDMMLIEALKPEGTVGEVIDEVRAKIGPAPHMDDELGRRLRRIADVGRLTLKAPELAEPAGRTGPVESTEPTEVGEAAGSAAPDPVVAAPGRSTRVRFPGRRFVAGGLRALRRMRGDADIEASVNGRSTGPEEPEAAAASDGSEAAPETAHRQAATTVENVEPALEGDQGPEKIVYLESPVVGTVPDGAIPVYAVFQVETGPALSLAMLTASARHHRGGVLNERFEIRRVEDPASFYADLEKRSGPAVLLLSHYLWSRDHNLEVARRGKEINPDLVIIHGGPSMPKYEAECEAFFQEHGDLIDVAARGEGEITLAETLLALGESWPELDVARLASVEGITYRDPTDGAIVRNDDRERVADLDSLPSPYLTGEYDHLHPSAWGSNLHPRPLVFETNRGCPYGCTFCDWGSSTLSRVRKFSLDRLQAEMEWVGPRLHGHWTLGDANFGIMSRDVETADRIVSVKEKFGRPNTLGFNVAKNTTKHLTAIIDRLVAAGVAPFFTLALQSMDEATLEAIQRTNISTDHYLSLAAAFRRRSLPASADIMLGLPGQSLESLTGDLQFLISHAIPARIWITQLLPNSPLNDPAYREKYQIESDQLLVLSTSTYTREDRAEMLRLRHAYTIFERFGLLRHVMRMVQWDHGVEAMTLLRRVIDVSRDDPGRYPLLNWVMRYFDYFNVAPLGWRSFTNEVRRFLADEFGIPVTTALDAVLELQAFLLPEFGRSFPETILLDHDYASYFADKTHNLWVTGHAEPSAKALEEYGPATFSVYADPLNMCSTGLRTIDDPRNETMTDGEFWLGGQWELDSPLVWSFAEVAAEGSFLGRHEQVPADLPDEPDPESNSASVRVRLARSALATSGSGVGDGQTD